MPCVGPGHLSRPLSIPEPHTAAHILMLLTETLSFTTNTLVQLPHLLWLLRRSTSVWLMPSCKTSSLSPRLGWPLVGHVSGASSGWWFFCALVGPWASLWAACTASSAPWPPASAWTDSLICSCKEPTWAEPVPTTWGTASRCVEIYAESPEPDS